MLNARAAYGISISNSEKSRQDFLESCEFLVLQAAEKGLYSCTVRLLRAKHRDLSPVYAELKKAGYETTFSINKTTGECKEITLSWDNLEMDKPTLQVM